MEEKDAVQVSFRLPAGALEGFSRLVEQLRLLAAEVSGGGTASPAAPALFEGGESRAFDLAHFQTLSRELAPPESAGAEISQIAEASGVRTEHSDLEGAAAVKADAQSGADEPEDAGSAVEDAPERVQAEARPEVWEEEVSPEDASTEEMREVTEASAVRTEQGDDLADAPAVRMELESQIQEAEAVWSEIQERNLNAVSARMEDFASLEAARAAEAGPVSSLETPRSRWGGVTEELAAAGSAPLTAEAVSLAFRRDGRRYDNGFPLY